MISKPNLVPNRKESRFNRNNFDFFSAREILPLWDKQIQSICYQVNGVIEKISASEPEWLAKTLDEEMSN